MLFFSVCCGYNPKYDLDSAVLVEGMSITIRNR